MTKNFDLIVIGGGSAGYAAARTATNLKKSVAIIDNSKELGGLCILRGCMPSKTLIYSAEILHLAQKAKLFGLNIPEASVDITALHERKKRIIREFAKYREDQLHDNKFTLFRESGEFISQNQFKLTSGDILTGKFVIATGSYVSEPSLPGLKESNYITSDDILELDYLPESVIVLGGGIVACELAQFLSRIGCKVTQIQRSPHILKKLPPEAATILEHALRDENIELFTGTKVTEIKEENGEFTVAFEHNGETVSKSAQKLFNALGRNPNTHNLGLENANVELLKSGHIATNDFCQSKTNPAIYAAGDCTGPHEIVHVAILQGECAANHAFGEKATPINYDHLVKIVFTDPQIGIAGLDENELKERNIDYISAEYPFDDHGKSILMEAKYGHVKIFAEKSTKKILGAQCVGIDASELIHSTAIAISLGATVHDLLKTHWYHPTLSEIWTYPLEDLAEM